MKTQIRGIACVVALICALAHGRAQNFIAPTYQLNNQTTCTATVHLEYYQCTYGCTCFYAPLVSYTVPAGATISIPVTVGDDAHIWVDLPGNPWLGAVALGCIPMSTTSISGSLSNSNCTRSGNYTISTAPSMLTIQ